jgi:separase
VVDFLSPALDTYFVLSRVTLIPTDADSHTRSYKLLEKASLFPGLAIHDTESNTHQSTNIANGSIDASMRANYVRCISGAFHNLSAVLYQAGKHASAARFLRQACELGLRALEIHQKASVNEAGEDKTQVWTQLADQVYRRWELLGVCYSKIGERKVRLSPLRPIFYLRVSFKLAYKAFIEAIAACAHADTSLEHAAASSGLDQLFGTHPQLGHIVDRATYIATSDLLLAPAEVPLNVPLRVSRSAVLGRSVSSSVLGVVLERQVICLEQNKWKEHARDAIRATLAELLNIYSPDRMPLRRLRVLVKCLQMGYYSGNISLGPAELDAETILKEIVSLSSRTVSNLLPSHLLTVYQLHDRITQEML